MHREALRQVLAQELAPKILVFGELFLEHHVIGEAAGVAPEGPVVNLRVVREEISLGGAGEVAQLLTSLGSRAVPISPIGQEEEARSVRRLMDLHGVDGSGLVGVPHYHTRVVMRFTGRSTAAVYAPMLRAEWLGCHSKPQVMVEPLFLRKVRSLVEEKATVVLLPEWGFGATPVFLRQVFEECQRQKAPIFVAANPYNELALYHGAYCLFINDTLLTDKCGVREPSLSNIKGLATDLANELEVEYLIIYSVKHGHLWCKQRRRPDLVELGISTGTLTAGGIGAALAVLAFVHSLGGDLMLAWELLEIMTESLRAMPNSAPGSLRRFPTRAELVASLTESRGSVATKVLTSVELQSHVAEGHLRGEEVVFAGGNFDVLLPGHVAALQWAKTLGQRLIVGVRSDRCLRNMGAREIIPQVERAAMVASLDGVDLVVVSEDLNFADILSCLRPQVVVKGMESPWDAAIGWQIVELYGGRIVTAPLFAGRPACRLVLDHRREEGDKPPKGSDQGDPVIIRFPAAA